MPNFTYFGRLVWSGPWGWLKSNLHLIIGGNLYLTDRIPRQRGQERHKYAESLSYLKLFGIDAVLVVDGAVILHNTDQFGAGAVEVAARMQSHIAESLDHEYLKKWRKLTQQMKASFSQSMDTG